MKLTVLGCNGPYPAPGGACSGYLLQEGDTGVLRDCGAGVLAQLEKHMPPQNLTAIVLSHLHYDHMSDMLPLIYRCPGLPVLCSGGVASNRQLRAAMERSCGALFAQPCYSTDNAMGVAILTRRALEGGELA